MAQFLLSQSAQGDLDAIADYTLSTWGKVQTHVYLDTLQARLQQLAMRPQIGRRREELGPGLLSFPHDRHVIYYTFSLDGITVIRILHQRQDVNLHLDIE